MYRLNERVDYYVVLPKSSKTHVKSQLKNKYIIYAINYLSNGLDGFFQDFVNEID